MLRSPSPRSTDRWRLDNSGRGTAAQTGQLLFCCKAATEERLGPSLEPPTAVLPWRRSRGGLPGMASGHTKGAESNGMDESSWLRAEGGVRG